MMPLKIAIVGGGFSGAMVATHLLRTATQPLTIQMIDPLAPLGKGTAYRASLDCHLLNVPAGKMSAFPDDPNHFLRWLDGLRPGFALRQQPDFAGVGRGSQAVVEKSRVCADTFVARRRYGQYVQATLQEAIDRSQVKFEPIADEAVAIQPGQLAKVNLAGGAVIAADRVVLALGNLPPGNPPVANPKFYQSQRYVRSPWSQLSFGIDPDDDVLLVGSGLTMLDIACALYQQGHRGTIYVVSRRGQLPQPHQLSPAYSPILSLNDTPKTVRDLTRRIRRETAIAQAQGYPWQAAIDALRPVTQQLWQALPPAEQQQFLRHLQPYWDTHRHRVAPAIVHTLTHLLHTRQLICHTGRIQSYQEDASGVDTVIKQRTSGDLRVVRSSVVINCTGSEFNYRKAEHPLIQNLLATGLIHPHSLNIGLNVAANGALIDRSGNPSDWLYTLGAPRKGDLWETTAVPEIRQQAQQLAQTLLTPHNERNGFTYSSS